MSFPAGISSLTLFARLDGTYFTVKTQPQCGLVHLCVKLEQFETFYKYPEEIHSELN